MTEPPEETPAMRVGRTAAETDTGRRRLRNEDAFVCRPPLFAVTDGMGGAQAGELASRLAAAALEERTREMRGTEAVVELVREANARIYRRALEDPAAAGMGTTATVALVDEEDGSLALGHVGDSRAYRIRDGALEQLTEDHSLVGELLRSGRLTQEEAAEHPQRSVITRALGTDPDVEVDTLTVEIAPGDLFLICSDGLTAMVRDADVLDAAGRGENDPGRIAALLIEEANRAGGEDNITVIVFEIVEGTAPEEDEELPEPDETTEESPPLRAATTAASPLPQLDEVTATDAVDEDGEADEEPEVDEEPEADEEPEPEPEPEPAPRPARAATTVGSPLPDVGVRHHGAGHGGRVIALAGIALALVAAVLLVYWGIAR
jgi:protein phosphatase